MGNKGYPFEKETVDLLKKEFGDDSAYRVFGSGRNKLNETSNKDVDYDGDVIFEPIKDLKFKIECKHYKDDGGRKGKERSLRVKKDWLDQNKKEAEDKNEYSIVAVKFKYTSDNAVQYIIPQDHFLKLIDELCGNVEAMNILRDAKKKSELIEYSDAELVKELHKRME